jgi:hypothetical protein
MGGPYADTTLGAELDLTGMAAGVSTEALLFGEDHGRAVVTLAPTDIAALESLAVEHGVPWHVAGRVGRPGGELRMHLPGETLEWDTGHLRSIYLDAIPRRMRQVAPSGPET